MSTELNEIKIQVKSVIKNADIFKTNKVEKLNLLNEVSTLCQNDILIDKLSDTLSKKKAAKICSFTIKMLEIKSQQDICYQKLEDCTNKPDHYFMNCFKKEYPCMRDIQSEYEAFAKENGIDNIDEMFLQIEQYNSSGIFSQILPLDDTL